MFAQGGNTLVILIHHLYQSVILLNFTTRTYALFILIDESEGIEAQRL